MSQLDRCDPVVCFQQYSSTSVLSKPFGPSWGILGGSGECGEEVCSLCPHHGWLSAVRARTSWAISFPTWVIAEGRTSKIWLLEDESLHPMTPRKPSAV